MTQIERQVGQAQRRLWLNRWLRLLGWSLVGAITIWSLLWIADRLLLLGWPMTWVAAGIAGSTLITSLIWFVMTREPRADAAAAFDEAAGLKERVSTSLHFAASTDPFAQAARTDAERSIAGLSARKFIPVRWTRSLSWSAALLGVALLLLLLPEWDLLGRRSKKAQAAAQQTTLRSVQLAVAKPAESIKQIVEKIPELKDSAEYKDLQDGLKDKDKSPDALRRDAIKKLDRMQDRLKQEAAAERFKALEETKKLLGKVQDNPDDKSELGKLLDALTDGDFKEAEQQLKKAQEELAKKVREGKMDPEKAKEMQKQLNDMSQKLQKAAEQQKQQSQQQLQNAGLSKEEAQKMLETLAKADKKQLEKLAQDLAKRMKDKGVTEQQMKDMLEKIKDKQQAAGQCNKLGNKMGQAGQKMAEGDTKGASEEMQQAANQLNDMEQLEQTLNDIESKMSEMQEARDQLGDKENEKQDQKQGQKKEKCKTCKGTGFRKDGSPCPDCDGSGECDGDCDKDGKGKDGKKPGKNKKGGGRGVGPRDRDDSAETQTVDKKSPTPFDENGRVIGQQFVKGRQIKGKSEVELQDAASAAELDATDALNRDRVSRTYRKSVKTYFDRLPEGIKADEDKSSKAAPAAPAKSKKAEGGAAKP